MFYRQVRRRIRRRRRCWSATRRTWCSRCARRCAPPRLRRSRSASTRATRSDGSANDRGTRRQLQRPVLLATHRSAAELLRLAKGWFVLGQQWGRNVQASVDAVWSEHLAWLITSYYSSLIFGFSAFRGFVYYVWSQNHVALDFLLRYCSKQKYCILVKIFADSVATLLMYTAGRLFFHIDSSRRMISNGMSDVDVIFQVLFETFDYSWTWPGFPKFLGIPRTHVAVECLYSFGNVGV